MKDLMIWSSMPFDSRKFTVSAGLKMKPQRMMPSLGTLCLFSPLVAVISLKRLPETASSRHLLRSSKEMNVEVF